jgi:predicted DNA-binding transcriptional regulator AlpA
MRAWDWPRNVLKRDGGEPRRFREIASIAPILVSAAAAAVMLGVSKRSFHRLRKRNDFPRSATVVLGPRCVRYRREALQAFALSLASTPRGEPEQLKRGRRLRSTP